MRLARFPIRILRIVTITPLDPGVLSPPGPGVLPPRTLVPHWVGLWPTVILGVPWTILLNDSIERPLTQKAP